MVTGGGGGEGVGGWAEKERVMGDGERVMGDALLGEGRGVCDGGTGGLLDGG